MCSHSAVLDFEFFKEPSVDTERLRALAMRADGVEVLLCLVTLAENERRLRQALIDAGVVVPLLLPLPVVG